MDDLILENKIIVYADKKIFSKQIILKATYWFTDKFTVNINSQKNHYQIILKSIDADDSSNDLKEYLLKIRRDLIDFELRQVVRKETSLIQQLLVAKAFSNNTMNENPPGKISDPVGFNINEDE